MGSSTGCRKNESSSTDGVSFLLTFSWWNFFCKAEFCELFIDFYDDFLYNSLGSSGMYRMHCAALKWLEHQIACNLRCQTCKKTKKRSEARERMLKVDVQKM